MDFITHLPKTDDGYDCIMVVIDKFSKRAHFIPTTSGTTAHGTAQLLVLRHSLKSSWITIEYNF
jgi:hypothetical protein